VCVDVVELIRVDAGVGEAVAHRDRGVVAVLVRLGQVRAVSAAPKALHFGVDSCAALLCVFILLEDKNAGPFGHDEAVAISVERAAGSRGIVVAGAERFHGVEGAQSQRGHGGFAATGEDHVAHAVLDQPEGVAHRVGGRGAGRGHRRAGAAGAEADGYVSAGGVDHQFRNREGRYLRRPLIHQPPVLLLEFVQTADARAGDHAHAMRVDPGKVESAVLGRVDRRGDRELGEPIHAFSGLRLDPPFRIEGVALAREMGVECARVEPPNRRYSAPTREQPVPVLLDRTAEGRHHAHARNHNPPLCHAHHSRNRVPGSARRRRQTLTGQREIRAAPSELPRVPTRGRRPTCPA